MTGAGPRKSGTINKIQALMGVAGTQLLESSRLPPRVCIAVESELGATAGNPIQVFHCAVWMSSLLAFARSQVVSVSCFNHP